MTQNLHIIADRLGALRAQIVELQAIEKELKAQVIDFGEPVEGDLFRATPVFAERDTVNWKAIAEKLNPSRQLVAAHTKHSVSVSVRVSAKSAGKAA